jgi:predicted AAA+ superfamily ATPase
MIEQYGVQFLLTGSSARSLRRKGVNLLGGRARSRILHPFVRTLIACEVPALTETRKRKAISTAKYYLFDIGLVRYLQGRLKGVYFEENGEGEGKEPTRWVKAL